MVEPGCVRLLVNTELVAKVRKWTDLSKSPPETCLTIFFPPVIIYAWAPALIYFIMLCGYSYTPESLGSKTILVPSILDKAYLPFCRALSLVSMHSCRCLDVCIILSQVNR